MNFFILEGLVVPRLDEATTVGLATAAARLSCIDDRYVEVAEALGVDLGPVSVADRLRLRAEIDATVARVWGLTASEVKVILADFTANAVPAEHRRLVLEQLG